MTKEEFLALAAQRYDELQALNKLNNFYDYEKEFVSIWKDLGREVLEKNISELPKDKRKKKMLTTTMGRISINNAHDSSRGNHGFQISALLQELMVYSGQLQCYAHCQEVIEKFLCVQVSATQVYRLTDLYGKELGETVDFTTRTQPPLQAKEHLYVEADASMVLTRGQGWKEVKAGRVFKSTDCLHPEGKQGMITHSQYLAQLGS